MKESNVSPLMSEFLAMMDQVQEGNSSDFPLKSNDILLRSRTSKEKDTEVEALTRICLLYTSPSPRDRG